MRKIILLLTIASAVFSGCDKYDDSSIKSDINDLKQRVAALEQQCKMMNENITSIQSILSAVQKQDGIVSVTDLPDGAGYSVLFSSGKLIYLYNGKNGVDGRDGIDGNTPQISVRIDSDGIYYWTIDGEWMVVDGKKVKAIGADGKDGTNGKDAITPQLKIEDDFWYITYDEGKTWIKLDRAKGDDGKDGDNIFKSVTTEDGYAVFVLNDSECTTIKIPLASSLAVTSLKYIPEYSDLGAVVTYSMVDERLVPQPFLMKFEVFPSEMVDYIVKNWKECLSAKVVYTHNGTRAEAGDFVDMEIMSVTGEDGVLSVGIASDSLSYEDILSKRSDNYWLTRLDAYISVSISINKNVIRSDYIYLYPVRQGDIEYETEDVKPLWAKSRSVVWCDLWNNLPMGYYGYDDSYIAGRGRILITKEYDNTLTCGFFYHDKLRSIVFPHPMIFDSMSFHGVNLISIDFNGAITTNFISFSDCKKLAALDLSKVIVKGGGDDFRGIFGECAELRTLDLSNFGTYNMTGMQRMFYGCENLASLDLSNFDTRKVTNMRDMFERCSSLKSLNLSGFSTENVTDMSKMFEGCSSLESLDLSHFDTRSVSDFGMHRMFYNCSSLKSLDLSHFDTKNVTYMGLLFYGCEKLETLDLSNFNTGKVTGMSSMFAGCSNLKSLDLSVFSTVAVKSMSSMFSGCSSLKSLNLSSFDTKNVTFMSSMFSDCSNLPYLNLSNFDTSNVTNMSSMFSGCSGLKSLNLSGWTIKSTVKVENMFENCDSLKTIQMTGCDEETISMIRSVMPVGVRIVQ